MGPLTRRITWRNPCALESLPPVGRLHRAAWSASPRMRYELMKLPLRALFGLAYRLGLGGEGSFSLTVGGKRKTLRFDGRNLQFTSLYMPQHVHGYEPDTYALLDALTGPESVFYDIGSNWGYFALVLAAREGYRGQVHAFEPVPGSFRDLKALVAESGLAERVTCHNTALSDRTGTGLMRFADGLHSGCAAVAQGGAGIEIALSRLDDLKLPRPDVVKMDVEDHEVQVLSGARRVLTEAKPHVIFESCVDFGAGKLAPFAFLKELGYVFFHPAWRTEDGQFVSRVELKDGEPATLALVPFEPEQRFLFKDLRNVYACHRDRLAELKTAFV